MKTKSIVAVFVTFIIFFATTLLIQSANSANSNEKTTIKQDIIANIYDVTPELAEDDNFLYWFLKSRQIHPMRAAAIEALSIFTNTFLQHTTEGPQIVYPDNFAGAFLEGNILVVQLTDLNQSYIDHYKAIVGMDAPVEFKQVEFSLNQLKDIGEEFVSNMKKSNLQVISHGINIKNNLYIIVLSSFDPLIKEIIPGLRPASDFIPDPMDEELINNFKAASEYMPVSITIGIFAGGRRIGFPVVEENIFYDFHQMPEFELIRSGSKNIYVEMSVLISTEGVLMYTLYNETLHSFGFIPERVLLYKETPDGFVRLSPINEVNLGYSAYWLWSGSSLSLSVDIGNIFFTDGKITPGVYKFVRVICRMNDPMGVHIDIIFLTDTLTYAVFEIMQ